MGEPDSPGTPGSPGRRSSLESALETSWHQPTMYAAAKLVLQQNKDKMMQKKPSGRARAKSLSLLLRAQVRGAVLALLEGGDAPLDRQDRVDLLRPHLVPGRVPPPAHGEERPRNHKRPFGERLQA